MKFQAYTPKEKIEFVRNEDYDWAPDIWGHTGPAYLEKFTVIVADEPAARVTALESGDATAIEDTPGQDVARLQADSRFQLIKGEIPGHPRGFFQNTERAPLDDLNVRKALETGINREEVVQLATFGTQPMSPGPFSPPTPGHSAAADNFYPFDAAKAGEMLDAAGWTLGADGIRAKGGEQLTLTTIGFAIFRALYEASQSNLRQIGVNLDLQILDTAAAVEAEPSRRPSLGDDRRRRVATRRTSRCSTTRATTTATTGPAVQDPAFDKMWDDAAAELDRDKRLEHVRGHPAVHHGERAQRADAGDRAQQLLCRGHQGREARCARHLPLVVRHLHRGLTVRRRASAGPFADPDSGPPVRAGARIRVFMTSRRG